MSKTNLDPDTFGFYTVSVVYYLDKYQGWEKYKAVSISEDYGCQRFTWYDAKDEVPLISELKQHDTDIHTLIWIHPQTNRKPTQNELYQMRETRGINLYSMNPSGFWYDPEIFYKMDEIKKVFAETYPKKNPKFEPQKPIQKNVNYIYT